MHGVRQAVIYTRQAIGLALILLFGPLPVVSLLAQTNQPQCQMACCKRKGTAACPLHHSANGDSVSLGFHAAAHCTPGCSQVAAPPSAFAAGVLRSDAWAVRPQVEESSLAGRAASVRWIVDCYLHQRPPPCFSSYFTF